MTKRWEVAEPCPPDFPAAVGVGHPVIAQLLWNRGLRTKEEVGVFLSPSWEDHVHAPSAFRQMADAVARIFRALENGERIIVHGDYDADGITGSTVLIKTLREIERLLVGATRRVAPTGGTLIDFYIPHRDKEGYGLHAETVRKLKTANCKLIITVDCGIACVEEIALAKSCSMDTIVVDHHQFGETLPDAHLIHPGVPGESYPFRHLAAVGVSFKLACALLDEARRRGLGIPDGWEKWLLDLVAIATVTDMVPLVGENRSLMTYGLKVLNKTRRPGLKALIDVARLSGNLDTESIGFAIGPRLNAAGRMDHATLALRLLLAESEDEARALALELERRNRERQEATKKMMEEADAKIRNPQFAISNTVFLWDERWSPALVGLVAGKYLERHRRPTVVVGHHAGKWIGSGRSFGFFDITSAMRRAGEGILTRIGGHVQACGFALEDAGRLPELAERLQEISGREIAEEQLVPTLGIDAEIPLDAVDESLIAGVDRFAPFGEGNRRPVFLSRGCFVAQSQTVGSVKNHLRLTVVSPSGRRMPCIGFKLGPLAAEHPVGSFVDLVYTVDVNEWNGRRDLQLKLVDVRAREG